MSRSLKKGPYIDQSLARVVARLNEEGEKRVVKTWARRSTIPPDFVGHTIAIHNGNKFVPVYVTERAVAESEAQAALAERAAARLRELERGARPEDRSGRRRGNC